MSQPYGSDICGCGDFRSQHKDGARCSVCSCECGSFCFYSAASPQDAATWEKYHAPNVAVSLGTTPTRGQFEDALKDMEL